MLQGIQSAVPGHLLLHVCSISDDLRSSSAESAVPPEIVSLLNQYKPLFEAPTSLPPSRACNHRIPLLPGAQPVFIRPYRYPPSLKDEIEK